MGVHGLTTYLRENKRVLSTTHELPREDSSSRVPIVVDAWSFIYNLQQSPYLPWVYGGENSAFAEIVTAVVKAWVDVGFKIYFVFDGPYPQLKFSTLVSRQGQSHIQPALLFFRTSEASRSSPRFLNETRILPPLVYSTCVETLRSISESSEHVEVHFADEEGDPYAVELAGKVNGYVIGNDSDFLILNSERYLGYIPLDEMTWHAVSPDGAAADDDGDDDFQTVRKSKGRRKPDSSFGRGIIPPPGALSLRLTFSSYQPATLASHLQLPVTLLPLVGALVGNDFLQAETHRRQVQGLFFDRQLTLPQRINHVALTIKSILAPSSNRKKTKHPVGSVMDLIDRTVNALLLRSPTTFASGEITSIIDKIVEATLQYAIHKHEGEDDGTEGQWVSPICALHGLDECHILSMFSRRVGDLPDGTEEQVDALGIREEYLKAYRAGYLSPRLLNSLHTGTYWPRLFLENPDFETVATTIARPIRLWIYSILDASLGLPEVVAVEEDGTETSTTRDEKEVESSDEEQEDDDADDEVIDVVESDSDEGEDPLAPLKGALQSLRRPREAHEDVMSATASVTSSSSAIQSSTARTLPIHVTEYIRRGTRVAEETVVVPSLISLLTKLPLASGVDPDALLEKPLLCQSIDDRITVLLQILESDIPAVRELPFEHVIPVITLRWVVRTLHKRAQESPSREREGERWTKREGLCFLATLLPVPEVQETRDAIATYEPPAVVDRHVQLVAQATMALDVIEQLAQTLLLADQIPFPFRWFSGKLVYTLLTAQSVPVDITQALQPQLQAVTEGLEDAFSGDRLSKKARKAKKPKEYVPIQATKRAPKSLFDMLGTEEA
ncbi:PIN domain-like protein [Pluteus cervinus]|uniref:PIN domain-like protein n=1 Tax=Pluteus cervinus TaxID=181527 RepID=A0ACD3B7D2_9AGAR|nr:PIN domain-like protein [Pluteus cervinus]